MLNLLISSVGIGLVAGLRTFTAPAVVSWAAHLGWLNLSTTPFAFMSSGIAVGLLTALAIGELIADKHPKMPDRTAPPGLIARFVSGGFSGAVICSAAGYDILTGIIVGGIGSLAGAFAGFEIRRLLTRDLSLPNLLVALTEDAVAIALGLFFVDPRF